MNLNMLFKNETDLKNAIINKLKIQFGKNIEDTSMILFIKLVP